MTDKSDNNLHLEEKTNTTKHDNNMDTSEPSVSTEVAATTATLRLSPFWSENPKVWFITTELQFSLHKVTRDELKYGQLILALTQDQCSSVLDVLQNPPPTNKYESLKAALIERNSLSEERKLEILLDKSDVGDKPPSEILRQIKILAGPNFNQDMIKSLWTRKLPEYIRLALITTGDDKTLDELVRTADKLNEATTTSKNVSSIHRQSRTTTRRHLHHPSMTRVKKYPQSNQELSLEERMDRVEFLLTEFTSNNRSLSRNRRFPSRKRSISRNTQQRFGACWYHRKFGSVAQKCIKPCNFRAGSSTMQVEQSSPNQ